MPKHDAQPTDFDWRLTSFEGARREQLRRWAELPLENIIQAIEEMEDISRLLASTPGRDGKSVRRTRDSNEQGKSPTAS